MHLAHLICVNLLLLTTTVFGQSGTDLKKLKTKLFTTDNYNNKVRPVTDQSNTVQVRYYFIKFTSVFLGYIKPVFCILSVIKQNEIIKLTKD